MILRIYGHEAAVVAGQYPQLLPEADGTATLEAIEASNFADPHQLTHVDARMAADKVKYPVSQVELTSSHTHEHAPHHAQQHRVMEGKWTG